MQSATLDLRTEDSAKRALDEVSRTLAGERTQEFYIENRTQHYILTLVLCEGYDESGNQLPPGYQRDTGLTVTGQNVMPGTSQNGVIQANINVTATLAKGATHWKRSDGAEGDSHLQDQTAQPGHYFSRCGWRAVEGRDGGLIFQQIVSVAARSAS